MNAVDTKRPVLAIPLLKLAILISLLAVVTAKARVRRSASDNIRHVRGKQSSSDETYDQRSLESKTLPAANWWQPYRARVKRSASFAEFCCRRFCGLGRCSQMKAGLEQRKLKRLKKICLKCHFKVCNSVSILTPGTKGCSPLPHG